MPRELNRIIEDLESMQVHLTARLNEWAAKFQLNPHHELRWGGPAFDMAAELHVIRGILPFLRGEVNPDFTGDRAAAAAEEYRRDVLRDVTNTGCSTSPAANLAQRCEVAAKAKLLETLGYRP